MKGPPAAQPAASTALPPPQLAPQALPTPRQTVQPESEPQLHPQQQSPQRQGPGLPRQPSLSSNPSWASLDSEAATERMKAKTRAFLARVETGKRQAQGQSQGRGHSQDTSATTAVPAPTYPTSILAAGRASRASSGSTRLRVQFRTPEVRDSHGWATGPAPSLAGLSIGEDDAEQMQPVVIPSFLGPGAGAGSGGAAGLWLGHAEAERSVGELHLHMQDVEGERDTSPGDVDALPGSHKVQAGLQQEVQEEQQQHYQQHSPPGVADAGMAEVLQRIRQMVLGAAVLTEPAQSSTAAGSLSFRVGPCNTE